MPHRCGSEIHVKDWAGTMRARYLFMCSGHWVKITHDQPSAGGFNGYLLSTWEQLTEDILTYVVARPSASEGRLAGSVEGGDQDGIYYRVQLARKIRCSDLARMVGAAPEAMRAYLADFALVDSDG